MGMAASGAGGPRPGQALARKVNIIFKSLKRLSKASPAPLGMVNGWPGVAAGGYFRCQRGGALAIRELFSYGNMSASQVVGLG